MNSAEVARNLDSAREELRLKERTLVEKKEAFLAKVQAMLPDRIEHAISAVISRNAELVEKLSSNELAKMKKALTDEKPKAVEKGVSSLRSSDWMWCPSSGTATGRAPFSWPGINEEGPIWQSLQSYSKDLESILKKYGFKLEEQTAKFSMSPFRVILPKSAEGKKEELDDLNHAVGKANKEYCDTKRKVTYLEQLLKETKAREKYETA
ncbi:MAG TPA: hypothetical protein VJZ32_07535 [Candidatus Bathyarchaeia archaeon]|nr:hypothetical protein [Candidatus Bathyarchaeia archaeon]HKM79206.1 hypothetical protein [Candidatus Bathyarchaeia archaeon]